jgi:hypothetical protein
MDLVPTQVRDFLELHCYSLKSEGLSKDLFLHIRESPYVPHLSACSAATGSDCERVSEQDSQSERLVVQKLRSVVKGNVCHVLLFLIPPPSSE